MNEAPTAIGSTGSFSANSFAGDTFMIDNGLIAFSKGYTSGTTIAGSITFANQTFDSMGLTPGSGYTVTWGSGASLDSATLTVVPEPSFSATAAGLLALAYVTRRRGR